MSKSDGNVIAPQSIIDQSGGEILRLWVASENYREDIRVSHEILKRLTEAYRKIRNTFRFLLGNLHDFNPGVDAVPLDRLEEIDRYILYRFQQVAGRILKAYEDFEFHVFYQAFYHFCVVDLSAFYLDIIKDRLYTFPRNSPGRRSGQTALHHLLMGMTQLMAPILSFTAEEVWSHLPPGSTSAESVHLGAFPDFSGAEFPDELVRKWDGITQLKGEVSKALELERRDKVIGHSLDARVRMVLPPELKKALAGEAENLQYILIVSDVEVVDRLDGEKRIFDGEVLEGLKVAVSPAPGTKCGRCWNYFREAGDGKEDSNLCSRCIIHLESTKA